MMTFSKRGKICVARGPGRGRGCRKEVGVVIKEQHEGSLWCWICSVS